MLHGDVNFDAVRGHHIGCVIGDILAGDVQILRPIIRGFDLRDGLCFRYLAEQQIACPLCNRPAGKIGQAKGNHGDHQRFQDILRHDLDLAHADGKQDARFMRSLLDPHIEDQRQNTDADDHDTNNQARHHVLHGGQRGRYSFIGGVINGQLEAAPVQV